MEPTGFEPASTTLHVARPTKARKVRFYFELRLQLEKIGRLVIESFDSTKQQMCSYQLIAQERMMGFEPMTFTSTS